MMEELMTWVSSHEKLILKLGTVSLIMFAMTLVLLPIAIIKLPEDYFYRERRGSAAKKHPFLLLIFLILKNLIGFVFIVVGLVLLVLPGQGVITILIGLVMTHFPGKHKIVCRIANRPFVGKALNKIRKLGGQSLFIMQTVSMEDSTE